MNLTGDIFIVKCPEHELLIELWPVIIDDSRPIRFLCKESGSYHKKKEFFRTVFYELGKFSIYFSTIFIFRFYDWKIFEITP